MLLEHGGIYLDIDTLCVRPFTALRTSECVLGQQPKKRGLCNAVILSEPRGVFLTAWLDRYHSFRSRGRDWHWDEHSVRVPARSARTRELRSHITVLNERAFFFPHWTEMECLFESADETLFQDSYCIHYWETLTRERWLQPITPETAVAGLAISRALCGACCERRKTTISPCPSQRAVDPDAVGIPEGRLPLAAVTLGSVAAILGIGNPTARRLGSGGT